MTRRERPNVAEILGTPPGERVERDDFIARASLFAGPALALLPVVIILVPSWDSSYLVALLCFSVAPAVVSLAWRPGGSRSRARTVTVLTALIVGAEIGWVGLQANPCAADPTVVGIIGFALTTGSFLAATAAGRQLALGGRLLAPLIAGGLVGLVGMVITAYIVLPEVLVLC
jgi:hypothetical protein